MVSFMENLIQVDDLGVPLFQETPHMGVLIAGGETYVWFSSKRLCHFRQRLHNRLKDAMCRLTEMGSWVSTLW